MMISHEHISNRAREIWEREGRPEGRDKEHWLRAEAELRQESLKEQTGVNVTSTDDAMLKVPTSLKNDDAARKRNARRYADASRKAP